MKKKASHSITLSSPTHVRSIARETHGVKSAKVPTIKVLDPNAAVERHKSLAHWHHRAENMAHCMVHRHCQHLTVTLKRTPVKPVHMQTQKQAIHTGTVTEKDEHLSNRNISGKESSMKEKTWVDYENTAHRFMHACVRTTQTHT